MTSGERVELSKAILLSETLQGFFLCSQGLHSHLNLGDFFPNFEKKSQSSKKKFFFFFFEDWDFILFFEDWDFHSVNTHRHYMVTFSFNLMAIVCVIASLFFY